MIELDSNGFVISSTKSHLGGNYPHLDNSSWCPLGWQYLITKYNIKTAIDLGGGYGFCSKWMQDAGVECVNIDGLDTNIENSVATNNLLHDLTVGPLQYPPVDFVNCIEVVEHIEEKYLPNLMQSLTLGKIIMITHARPGQIGYHHVNCQPSEYWIEKFSDYGYTVDPVDTDYVRRVGGWHIKRSGLVFKNA